MSDQPRQSEPPAAAPVGFLPRVRQLGGRLRASFPRPSALDGLLRPRSKPDPSLVVAGRPRPTRPPLPLTSLTLLVLMLLPAVQLLRMPRPRAVGLEQLIGQSSLLQSFPPTPERPVPALWRERLGAGLAQSLWRRQRGPWWQFWGDHADAAPLLAFSAASLPGGPAASLPSNALRVGDLVVVAADPLSRQLLRDRLLPQQRLSRGLNRRCLERLRQDQAVLWNATGLGVIAGPMAPLLQRLSRGCLSFALEDGGLIWQGEAADADGLLASPGASTRATSRDLPSLPADRLLELEGGATDLLLAGLLSRPLIRDPLSRRYGLDDARLALLRRTPFRLQLRPLKQGPFQASLELQLPLGSQTASWDALLEQLSRALVQQGLSPVFPSTAAADGSSQRAAPVAAAAPTGSSSPAPGSSGASAAPPPSETAAAGKGGSPASNDATWKRADGVIVGGWRWIKPGPGDAQLLLFLGPVPTRALLPLPQAGRTLPGPGGLRLRSRPRDLQALGLLPAQVPELVRRSEQLQMVAVPPSGAGSGTPLSLLSGGLRVPR